MKRTVVEAEFFIYASDVVDATRMQRSVAIVWTAGSFDVGKVTSAVRHFCDARAEVSEVWFVAPSDCLAGFERLLGYEDFVLRTERADREAYRFFTVSIDGRWEEDLPKRRGSEDVLANASDFHELVKVDGLRQMFRDSESLVIAGAGVHFGHPSGTHSERFMRAANAVGRTQHAYFLASYALGSVVVDRDMSFWADTAGILPVLYALKDLVLRLQAERFVLSIDTFTGYDGLTQLSVRAGVDYVFISSTTSGGLARKAVEAKRAERDRMVTLFAISEEVLSGDSGRVLVDMTNRDEIIVPSVRDARVSAYPSDRPLDGRGCRFCDLGIGLIELVGDGFFPSAQQLSLRMLRLSDRPWKAGGRPPRRFDGDRYFTSFYGLSAILPAARSRSHDTTLRLEHLLSADVVDASTQADILAAFDTLPKRDTFRAVVAMPDRDSLALAALVASHLGNSWVSAAGGRVWAAGVDPSESLPSILSVLGDEADVVLCAGVVASGRELQAQSRTFRVHTNVRWSYFVGGAHPESPQTWDVLRRSLSVQTSEVDSDVRAVWSLPREPRGVGESNPWQSEWLLLSQVRAEFKEWEGDRLAPIASRLLAIDDQTSSDRLMCGPDGQPIAKVSPGFALWPFEWTAHPRTTPGQVEPTQAEIYATVAHLMAESRRSAAYFSTGATYVRRSGTALDPAVFDRFNDPLIQACILRAARIGELDYHGDIGASRAMQGVLLHALREVGALGGDSAYEFALSVLSGLYHPGGSGLRLADGHVVETIRFAVHAPTSSTWPPLLVLLLDLILQKLGYGPTTSLTKGEGAT